MKILPYETFQIQTSLPLDGIVDLMRQNVEPKKWLRFSRSHKLFEGDVSSAGFKIMRIIHYRNSFLPVIQGTFEQGDEGTRINIRMRLHQLVMAFMCFWFGGVGIAMLVTAGGLFTGKTEHSLVLLIPIGMFLFGWGLTSISFWIEVKKARRLLSNILQETRQENQPIHPTVWGGS
jgi:hypothetical protein